MAGAREENLIRRLEETITCFTTSFVQNSSQLGSRSSRVNFFPGSGSQSTLGALRVAYIAALSHKSLKQKKLLTKRDVYYMCRSLFYDPAVVDRALQSLSISVDAPRNDLSIVAAPKGIVVGNVRYADEMGCNVDVGMFGRGGCLIPPRPERMTGVLVGADAIVVYVRKNFKSILPSRPIVKTLSHVFEVCFSVEKEAAFYSLLDDFAKYQLLETYVVITGKGLLLLRFQR